MRALVLGATGHIGAVLVRELLQSLRNSELGLKGRYRETLRGEFRRKGEELLLRATETP